jgi:hypothetical protein
MDVGDMVKRRDAPVRAGDFGLRTTSALSFPPPSASPGTDTDAVASVPPAAVTVPESPATCPPPDVMARADAVRALHELRAVARKCADKRRHRTEAAANRHAQSLWRERRVAVSPYQCDLCGGWHVGHYSNWAALNMIRCGLETLSVRTKLSRGA